MESNRYSCHAVKGKRRHAAAVQGAFTLTELLVVIAIIGAVAAISIPALKGITKSQTITTGARQLLEDVALARQYAILNRSVVHMVFVPPTVIGADLGNDAVAKRLEGGAYTTYAIYADRSIGDQPGQARPRYLTKWKTLPDGVIIPDHEFFDVKDPAVWNQITNPTNRPIRYEDGFWFPTLAGTQWRLPHISFNPDGSVRSRNPNRDEIIHLAQGSVLVVRGSQGEVTDFDVRESPPGNSTNNFYRVRIDGLTGRSSLERPEIK